MSSSEMRSLPKVKKNTLSQFIDFTGAGNKTAFLYLETYDWDISVAADEYLNGSLSGQIPEEDSFDESTILTLWTSYCVSGEEFIDGEALEKFLKDVNLINNDLMQMVLAWKLSLSEIGEISQEEFLEGFKNLNCQNLDQLKTLLSASKEELNNGDNFKEFYLFSFKYGQGTENDLKRVLELDVAIPLWELLLKDRFPLLNEWIKFVQV
eukprot:TRINITY_DN4935_c0_g1_i4.p1 TRINITY_DN4935_c0_g1~~TRINITY_DN4935_c0_g1_i4.p1  ORF type:complete len:209 (+),score=55.26 TRINITY_DN4935_c0_g1_i4:50-676(+)